MSFESGDDRARVAFSRPGDAAAVWEVELGPRERWDLVVDVFPHGDSLPHDVAQARFGEELTRVRDSLAAWQLRVPQIRRDWDGLGHAFGGRSPTSRRCACARRATSASCPRPGCRGS